MNQYISIKRQPLISFMALISGLILSLMAAMAQADESEEYFLYKTVEGDSLWNITERHLTDIKHWVQLEKLNSLPNSDYIELGTIIRIPKGWLKKREASATLTAIKGEVELKRDNQEIELDRKTMASDRVVLLPGTTIITHDQGLATIEFNDGSQLLLQSNSELELRQFDALGDGSLSDIEIKLHKGRVESSIPSSPISNTNYRVSTDVSVSSVRGTTFRVSVGAEDAAITEVLEGKVQADRNTDSQTILLKRGEAVVLDATTTEIKAVELLPPPVFEMETIVETSPFSITLPENPKATGYHLSIVPFGENPKQPIFSQSVSGNVVESSQIDDGRYHLFVSAIDELGVMGIPAQHDIIVNARPYAPVLGAPTNEQKQLLRELIFKWDAKDEALTSGYYLQISEDESFRLPIVNEPILPGVDYTLKEGLRAGVYYWRVAALDQFEQRGPFTEPQSFRVLLEKPALSAMDVVVSDIRLTWPALEEGSQYRIQVSTDANFNHIFFDETTIAAEMPMSDMKPGDYFFRVQTIASDGFVDEWSEGNPFNVPAK